MLKLNPSPRFLENYQKLDSKSQKAIKKAIMLLAQNPRHPSLRTKKLEGTSLIFESSANMDLRLTWEYQKPDAILLRNCGHHDRALNNP